ncbi:MAG TPA: hypothetical protein VMZ71_01025 [Gemmataceae bacterium]|nr:hypothetical protein [Gemmataceae bacterium]
MARFIALALVVWAGTAATASAQPAGAGAPYNPPFSPYLNLLRNNNPQYLNYYGLVRPQQQFQQAIQGLQSEVSATQSQIGTGIGASGAQMTGHNVRFLNTGRYFLSYGQGGGAGGGRVGTGGTPPRR